MSGSMTPRQASLASALAAAKHAALAAVGDGDDGGTANMDTAFLSTKGLRSESVRRAAEAAGVFVSHNRSRWWTGWFVHVAQGQGAMRTRMAEAAAKALTAAGEDASVYYQID